MFSLIALTFHDLVAAAMTRILWLLVLLAVGLHEALGCGPGRGPLRRRGARKIVPLIYKQHEPNFSEKALAASGLPDGPVFREDPAFRHLEVNYNPDILFKDEEGTGADRLMTKRCKEKLNTLAISVMNQWPGVRLRVTEAWDEENHHAMESLHYEGRAVDFTTSDRDRSKYGLLASLAVEAGFDWVYYESRSHVHASCKAESAVTSKDAGCFTAEATVRLESGVTVPMSQVRLGDRIQAVDPATGHLVYSEVLLFLDRDPTRTRRFVRLTTESGTQLTLTETHLLHVGPEKTVEGCMSDMRHNRLNEDEADEVSAFGCFQPHFAGNVQVGDSLLITTGDQLRHDRVVAVRTVHVTGVFAPLTVAGNLVVDGVVASCYAVIDSQPLAHFAFGPVRWWANVKHNARLVWRAFAYYASFGLASRSPAVASNLSASTEAVAKTPSSTSDISSANSIEESAASSLDRSSYSSDKINLLSRTLKNFGPVGVHWYADMLYSCARWLLPGHLVIS